MKLSYVLFSLSLLAYWGCNSSSPQTDSPVAKDPHSATSETITDTTHHQKLPHKNPPYIITRGQVGPIKIGMPLTEVNKIIYRENITKVAIAPNRQKYEIRLRPDAKTPDLILEETCKATCQVGRIHIVSTVIKTPEGLGIGSTLGEVKRFYKIDLIKSDAAEVMAVAQQSGISFLLDKEKIPSKTISRLTVANTPNEIKIIGLYIL